MNYAEEVCVRDGKEIIMQPNWYNSHNVNIWLDYMLPTLRTTPHQHECLNSNPSFEALVHKTANKSNFFTKHRHKGSVKFQTMMVLKPTQNSLST